MNPFNILRYFGSGRNKEDDPTQHTEPLARPTRLQERPKRLLKRPARRLKQSTLSSQSPQQLKQSTQRQSSPSSKQSTQSSPSTQSLSSSLPTQSNVESNKRRKISLRDIPKPPKVILDKIDSSSPAKADSTNLYVAKPKKVTLDKVNTSSPARADSNNSYLAKPIKVTLDRINTSSPARAGSTNSHLAKPSKVTLDKVNTSSPAKAGSNNSYLAKPSKVTLDKIDTSSPAKAAESNNSYLAKPKKVVLADIGGSASESSESDVELISVGSSKASKRKPNQRKQAEISRKARKNYKSFKISSKGMVINPSSESEQTNSESEGSSDAIGPDDIPISSKPVVSITPSRPWINVVPRGTSKKKAPQQPVLSIRDTPGNDETAAPPNQPQARPVQNQMLSTPVRAPIILSKRAKLNKKRKSRYRKKLRNQIKSVTAKPTEENNDSSSSSDSDDPAIAELIGKQITIPRKKREDSTASATVNPTEDSTASATVNPIEESHHIETEPTNDSDVSIIEIMSQSSSSSIISDHSDDSIDDSDSAIEELSNVRIVIPSRKSSVSPEAASSSLTSQHRTAFQQSSPTKQKNGVSPTTKPYRNDVDADSASEGDESLIAKLSQAGVIAPKHKKDSLSNTFVSRLDYSKAGSHTQQANSNQSIVVENASSSEYIDSAESTDIRATLHSTEDLSQSPGSNAKAVNDVLSQNTTTSNTFDPRTDGAASKSNDSDITDFTHVRTLTQSQSTQPNTNQNIQLSNSSESDVDSLESDSDGSAIAELSNVQIRIPSRRGHLSSFNTNSVHPSSPRLAEERPASPLVAQNNIFSSSPRRGGPLFISASPETSPSAVSSSSSSVLSSSFSSASFSQKLAQAQLSPRIASSRSSFESPPSSSLLSSSASIVSASSGNSSSTTHSASSSYVQTSEHTSSSSNLANHNGAGESHQSLSNNNGSEVLREIQLHSQNREPPGAADNQSSASGNKERENGFEVSSTLLSANNENSPNNTTAASSWTLANLQDRDHPLPRSSQSSENPKLQLDTRNSRGTRGGINDQLEKRDETVPPLGFRSYTRSTRSKLAKPKSDTPEKMSKRLIMKTVRQLRSLDSSDGIDENSHMLTEIFR